MYRKREGKNFNLLLTPISGCERRSAAAANTGSLAAYLTEHQTEREVLEREVLT